MAIPSLLLTFPGLLRGRKEVSTLGASPAHAGVLESTPESPLAGKPGLLALPRTDTEDRKGP